MKNNLVVFSGAGISAESGISTFRDSGGLWEKYSIEEVATPLAWKRNPDLVTDFYNKRRKQIIESQPNKAHLFFAKLQNSCSVHIITQNIDDLHERAGSSSVLHLHGNIRFAKSSNTEDKQLYSIDGWALHAEDRCPNGLRLRPHVVWFGEDVPEYSKAIPLISSADVFIVLGTSLQVFPAAGLVEYASAKAVKIIVDPNVDDFQIPTDFIKLKASAVDAIPELEKILISLGFIS